ncbi:hypothetical protein EYZ11_002330 [Aspergillus tanneri]|uniref:Mannosyl-oligosaccharide glucosidase n=1 Tax=Aspergillus tanneri TaxID=1220188 RepID=A0A4V3UQ95_9EURO|nr:hypothetical protein EYZ11_002330 [Aspergillus tanneri]
MAGYGWDEYDIRNGGRQTIHDAGNSLDLTIDFIKVPGGEHGGSWAARVKGVPRDDAPPDQPTTVIFYAALEGLGNLQVDTKLEDPRGFESNVKLSGLTPGLGDFTIDVTAGPESNEHPEHDHPSYEDKPLDRTWVSSSTIPSEHVWQTKVVLFSQMKGEVNKIIQKYGAENPPPPSQVFTIKNVPGEGNLHLVQKVFKGEFEVWTMVAVILKKVPDNNQFDILFTSGSSPKPLTCEPSPSRAFSAMQSMLTYIAIAESLTAQIPSNSLSFADRFEKILPPQSPFDSKEYSGFSKSMLSNLVGGIGYFYGTDIVDRSAAPEYDEENEGFWEETAEARARAHTVLEGPKELFTCVPSRPFFPRGFLWDEGFHLIPVLEWDTDLA